MKYITIFVIIMLYATISYAETDCDFVSHLYNYDTDYNNPDINYCHDLELKETCSNATHMVNEINDKQKTIDTQQEQINILQTQVAALQSKLDSVNSMLEDYAKQEKETSWFEWIRVWLGIT